MSNYDYTIPLHRTKRIGDNLHTRTAFETSRLSMSIIHALSSTLHLKVQHTAKVFGQLVVLGFDVAVFTPAPYQRRSLRRPSWSPHLAAGFALRCFQRLSNPDADTRRCTWRYNRQTGGLSNTVLSY